MRVLVSHYACVRTPLRMYFFFVVYRINNNIFLIFFYFSRFFSSSFQLLFVIHRTSYTFDFCVCCSLFIACSLNISLFAVFALFALFTLFVDIHLVFYTVAYSSAVLFYDYLHWKCVVVRVYILYAPIHFTNNIRHRKTIHCIKHWVKMNITIFFRMNERLFGWIAFNHRSIHNNQMLSIWYFIQFSKIDGQRNANALNYQIVSQIILWKFQLTW